MNNPVPPLFQDDKEADETLVMKSAILGAFCVASQLRSMWEWFYPYADGVNLPISGGHDGSIGFGLRSGGQSDGQGTGQADVHA